MLRSLSKHLPFFFALSALGLLLLVFVFATPPYQKNTRPPILPPATGTPQPTPQVLSPTNVLGESDSADFVPVIKVVDGDTITVIIEGKRETIRLIGINTPETVDPRRGVECFGREASDKAKSMILGQHVRLVSDPTQSDRDRYNRLLRYVFLSDGVLFNKYLIEEGYAYEYTYSVPYQFQPAFKAAEENARKTEKGLWGIHGCSKMQ